jgi:hypothetical protein
LVRRFKWFVVSREDRGLLRLPFFILVIAFLALAVAGGASAQISPGPLSKAHESLSGTSKCASCHQFGASTPTFKCLDCHKEIARALSANHGFHARVGIKNANGKDCVRCHLEHNGENFSLVHWELSREKFVHKLTGFELEGKHFGVVCEKCHTPSRMAGPDRPLIQQKDLARSYFGLSPDCVTCHTDPHKGQLGSECLRCHNVSDWKAAKQFDHSKTRYPLTGMHAHVACEKCHKPEAPGGPVRYKDMRFNSCTVCHLDPHRGVFKQRCEDCHTTAGWKKLLQAFAFDHSKTKYPLLGLHAKVSCMACHANGDFQKPLAFAKCVDCHSPDPHGGQFAARPKKGECAECHTVEEWKPSLFGVKEHATSKYPLEDKHAKVACAKCHTPAGKDTLYKVKFASCSDCHKDVHGGQFTKAPYLDRCDACHTVQDFHRSLFTIAKHRSTRFALTGGHVAVPCLECHRVGAAHRTDKIMAFDFEDRTCTACHSDPHRGEFNEQMARRQADSSKVGCEACHTTVKWKELNRFDHSQTAFPLVGAHRGVACGDCHRPPAMETTLRNVNFRAAPKQCLACHADVHVGQFVARKDAADCSSCHDSGRWRPSHFDHDLRTTFPLRGEHAAVRCDECHKLTREVDEKAVVLYKPTPRECKACHGQL